MNADPFLQVILASAALLYSLVVLGYIIGLLRLQYIRSSQTPLVSVIVAARNEEANLRTLIPALLEQDYSSYEIIIANDRSIDRTAEVLREYKRISRRLKSVDITSSAPGMPAKKHALSEAIRASSGEILCFTDADCIPSHQWISELVTVFDDKIGLVAGYSPYDDTLLPNGRPGLFGRLFRKFISYEELKAAAWSAGAIGLGRAWLCTGRNLAYRKRVYQEVGGFEHIKQSVSGDDDLFLQLVRRKTKWGIRYVDSPASFVRTRPPRSFSDFVEQRRRHFSAAKYFPLSMKTLFFGFHLSSLLLFLGFLCFLFGIPGATLGLPAFTVKLAADVTLFLVISEKLSQRGLAGYFLLMEILYILYNTFIGPLGLSGTYQWKPDQKT
ncbi:MAG: glycosyltransferase [Ignavibacteriales bacterium]|nr:glycosyltransferase [Ignavibacteriales bacterium]